MAVLHKHRSDSPLYNVDSVQTMQLQQRKCNTLIVFVHKLESLCLMYLLIFRKPTDNSTGAYLGRFLGVPETPKILSCSLNKHA